MPVFVRERYMKMKNSPIPNVDKMIETFDQVVSHSDSEAIRILEGVITQCKEL